MTAPKNPQPLEAREAAWFRRQYECGYSIAAMARELHIGPKRLSLLAKRMGFPVRARNESRLLCAILPPLPRFRPPKRMPKRSPAISFPYQDGDLSRWNNTIVPGWAVHDMKKAR